jgi:hypothetical protein
MNFIDELHLRSILNQSFLISSGVSNICSPSKNSLLYKVAISLGGS